MRHYFQHPTGNCFVQGNQWREIFCFSAPRYQFVHNPFFIGLSVRNTDRVAIRIQAGTKDLTSHVTRTPGVMQLDCVAPAGATVCVSAKTTASGSCMVRDGLFTAQCSPTPQSLFATQHPRCWWALQQMSQYDLRQYLPMIEAQTITDDLLDALWSWADLIER